MKKEFHINSLLFKIVCTVILGMICLAVLLGVINITISKKVFVDHFAESQQKIFNQIDSEFYEFYSDIADIMSLISRSEHVKNYLQGNQSTEYEVMQNRFLLNRQLQDSKIADYAEISTVIMGANEKSYIHSDSDMFAVSKTAMLYSDAARAAKENPYKIICEYAQSGFTHVMKRSPVVIMAKAFSTHAKEDTDGYVFITMKEEDIRRMYSHFVSSTSDIVILNQDDEVISSNNSEYLKQDSAILKKFETVVNDMTEKGHQKTEIRDHGNIQTYMIQRLQSTNYKIVGVINPEAAFAEQYNVVNLILLTLLLTAVLVCLIFMFVRQQTRPLATLANTMKHSKDAEFKERVQVEGTYEVRELSETYNQMVDELDRYINQLMQVEADKRSAEIHALQMQINPHYMYNTLASVKWLIWQGDADKSVKVIDAFISLLRNVISNSDEFVTVEQEIINLQNYVLINQARYGDAIHVEFFVLPQCNQYKIPKLILQPFVENAFFHAFPEGIKGCIQIFVKEEGKNLRFDIVDNGIGMKTEQLVSLNNKEHQKSEHFTGIGIGNVDDRIKLIYGMDYGINIMSEVKKGTCVTLMVGKK